MPTDSERPPVLTAAQMRAAEQVIFDSGVAVIDLMERAGAAVAGTITDRFDRMPTLVLCGPGNNGGDGYVVARLLREAGWPVRIAALASPATDASRIACERWNASVEPLLSAEPAALLVDGLFGTGLTRGLDAPVAAKLNSLVDAAEHSVAIDLPSGISTDDGAPLGPVPGFEITVALGALKPAHLLPPGNLHCGEIVLGDIGLLPIARRMQG